MKKEHEPQDWKEGRRRPRLGVVATGLEAERHRDSAGGSKGAVSQWLTRAKVEGREGLRRHVASGPQPKLVTAQLEQLPQLLNQGAEAFGFRGDVWTTARVAEVIKREFGVQYHPAHCSRILRAIKYSVQKPSQRDEAEISRWKDERWPALKKRPKRKNAPSSL